jgi:hypothetical protein
LEIEVPLVIGAWGLELLVAPHAVRVTSGSEIVAAPASAGPLFQETEDVIPIHTNGRSWANQSF